MPIALTTAALSSALLGASVTGTLSAFNASITNDTNTGTSGSLVMKEVGPDGSTTCLSSSGSNNSNTSCSTINKYGGTATPFTPGTTHTTVVKISNTGTTAVSTFALAPGACTKSDVGGSGNSGNLCDSLTLTLTCASVSSGGTVGSSVTLINAQTLNTVRSNGSVNIGSASSSCVPTANAGNSVQFTFAVSMPSGQDNTVQGQMVSQPLTWSFTGA